MKQQRSMSLLAGVAVAAACVAGLAAQSGGGSFLGHVSGVSGVDAFDDVKVTLTAPGVLETAEPDAEGGFAFHGIADGDYVVKARKPGFKSGPALPIRIAHGALVSDGGGSHEFALERLSPGAFVFHWEEDQSTAGYEYQANVVVPREVNLLGGESKALDNSSTDRLRYDYNIVLRDGSDSMAWTAEHAYRLLRTLEAIPQDVRDPWREQTLAESRWFIDPEHVRDDILVTRGGGSRTVRIAAAAFVNAKPKLALVEGKRGVYFSQRLHHALVRFVTDSGRDTDAVERILQERYGLTARIESYEELTASTTQEPAWRFQQFHSEELVQIINTLEEMPSGMRIVPGLRFVARRRNGTPNPVNPEAPAIAWTEAGYIEFMDKAFLSSSVLHTHRLILHEKSHFLWAHLFDDRLKRDWTELGGWYRDPASASGWATTKQTEFVSAYAHGQNPDEDMAESVAFFVVNPRKLRSRAPAKYEFIRDRVMQGSVYISQIREDLTFDVYNLFPDYVYPGKIRRVDIVVEGAPGEDKQVEIEIELHALDHVMEGATHAFIRIISEEGTYRDLYLYPVGVPSGTPGTVLAVSFEINRWAASGSWRPRAIGITDEHGLSRNEGQNDFGWTLLVNNPLEDTIPPKYVRNTASLSKSTMLLEDREVQVVHAEWRVDENSGLMEERGACFANLVNELQDSYGHYAYGQYDPERETCHAEIIMPHYMPSAVYSLFYLFMDDRAGNRGNAYFRPDGIWTNYGGHEGSERAQQIELVTTNSDTEPPSLDLNTIRISAVPTNPDAPNGETVVTLNFRARDNVSGFRIASIYLRDPQGTDHHHWIQPSFPSRWFPEGDPSQWAEFEWSIVLPVGSAPGTWGLAEMTLRDRAENSKAYDFTEIARFEVR